MASEMMILRHGSDKIGVTDAIYVPYLRLNKISLVERERERESLSLYQPYMKDQSTSGQSTLMRIPWRLKRASDLVNMTTPPITKIVLITTKGCKEK